MDKKMIGVLALCAMVLTGCATNPDAAATPTPTVTAQAPTTSPEDATQAAADAEQVAVAALTAFVNHGRSQEEWWADFSQYLSPEALYVWEGVRADRVSASAITGEPITTVVDGTFVTVILPTDAGSYRLDMAKRVSEAGSGGTWLVFEMTAPEAI